MLVFLVGLRIREIRQVGTGSDCVEEWLIGGARVDRISGGTEQNDSVAGRGQVPVAFQEGVRAMNTRTLFKKVSSAVVGFAVMIAATVAMGQALPLANFNTPGNTDGFTPAIPPDFGNSTYLGHNQVNGIGNTSGPGALRVEMGESTNETGNAGWAIRFDPAVGSDAFNAFDLVAQDESLWFLEFDMTVPAGEWGDLNIPDAGNLFLLNVAVNSDPGVPGDLGSFAQKSDVVGNMNFRNNDMGATYNVRVPMVSLPLSTGSGFYQLSIGASHDGFFDTGNGEGIDLYFDNFRFEQAPPTVDTTFYSWETPDNPGTPAIDERFEGWDDTGLNNPGDLNTTVHSIVPRASLGAPADWGEGNSALQIDRIDPADASTFHWGSNVLLNGTGNPTVQAQIDNWKDLIEGSTFIAFDLRMDDPDPFSPTFTRLAVYFTDGSGAFFQAEGDTIGAVPIGTTGTYLISTDIIDDANGSGFLKDVGFADGSVLGIGIATNSDGPGLYQIDNFRVITEITTTPGDFDEDGDVDGRDFLVWQRGGSPEPRSTKDLNDWRTNYGSPGLMSVVALGASVPEPGTILILAVGMICHGLRRK